MMKAISDRTSSKVTDMLLPHSSSFFCPRFFSFFFLAEVIEWMRGF